MFSRPTEFITTKRPYLVVINVPYFVDGGGRAFFERLWHHDLVQHLNYLPAFMLAAPALPLPADVTELVPLEEELRTRLKLIALPPQTSRIDALVQLPRTLRTLWHAVGQAEIVHTGVAGWPFPLGWL